MYLLTDTMLNNSLTLTLRLTVVCFLVIDTFIQRFTGLETEIFCQESKTYHMLFRNDRVLLLNYVSGCVIM